MVPPHPHIAAHYVSAHTIVLKAIKSTCEEIIASKQYYLLKKKHQQLLKSHTILMYLSFSSYPALENTFLLSELPRHIFFPYPSTTIHLKGCLSTQQLFGDRIGFPA
jgi:hypothetical protein